MYLDVCSMGNTVLPAPQPISRMDVGLSWLPSNSGNSVKSQCRSLKNLF